MRAKPASLGSKQAMSVDLVVYLNRDRLPTCEQWQQAIAAEGIEMTMDAVDTRTHTGFWPITHEKKECGFEYSCNTVDRQSFKLEGADEFLIGDRDCSVTFRWHSSLEDAAAASTAAAVLSKLGDGVLFDPQCGEHVVGAEAFELLVQGEQERERKLNEANRKWAKSTQRRCPRCSAPCPEYRPTCFVCDFAIGRA